MKRRAWQRCGDKRDGKTTKERWKRQVKTVVWAETHGMERYWGTLYIAVMWADIYGGFAEGAAGKRHPCDPRKSKRRCTIFWGKMNSDDG